MGSARYVYIHTRSLHLPSRFAHRARTEFCRFPGSPGAEITVEMPSAYISLGGLLCDLLGSEKMHARNFDFAGSLDTESLYTLSLSAYMF